MKNMAKQDERQSETNCRKQETLHGILGLSQDQTPTVRDLSLLLEIDLKLGRRTQFYRRLHHAMDFLIEQAEQNRTKVL